MESLIQAATVSKPSSPPPWPEVLRQAPEEPIKKRGSGHVCLGLPMSAMYKNGYLLKRFGGRAFRNPSRGNSLKLLSRQGYPPDPDLRNLHHAGVLSARFSTPNPIIKNLFPKPYTPDPRPETHTPWILGVSESSGTTSPQKFFRQSTRTPGSP